MLIETGLDVISYSILYVYIVLQTEFDRTEEVRKVESDDLQRQIEALDKQLKSNKQFLEVK